jgi:hypothetical protein
VETAASEGLETVDLPPLWPIPWVAYAAFAEADKIAFGWWSSAYYISKQGQLKSKILARFPLTEEGWVHCWNTLRADYPDLAKAVAQRVHAERAKLSSGLTSRQRSETSEKNC